MATRIGEFAVESIGRLAGEAPVTVLEDAKMGDAEESVKGEEVEEEKEEEEGKMGEWKEEDVVRHLEVFLALCSRRHELLVE